MRVARVVAAAARGRVTVLKVLSPDVGTPPGRVLTASESDGLAHELERFEQSLGPDIVDGDVEVELAIAFGAPGIEIDRLARLRGCDLIVLGRTQRDVDRRTRLGETADAVVRRSAVPVLFVPSETVQVGRLLVALDGTHRSAQVLEVATDLATTVGATVEVVTVEPDVEEVAAAPRILPRAGNLRSAERLHQLAQSEGVELSRVTVRRGKPIDEILEHTSLSRPDVLVIGYRRGGPSKVFGPADIARNLLYAAPAAVLTVPL